MSTISEDRGMSAAMAYLERAGMTSVTRRDEGGDIVLARDGKDLVAVLVETHRHPVGDSVNAEAVTAAVDSGSGITRGDIISILILAEDRALLRHHRSVYVPTPGI